jgi:uncharacterized membrane protein
MDWAYFVAGFIHDLSIAVYVGGAVAMEFILAPAQQSIPPAQAQIMGEKTANRFLILVWATLALIFVTGLIRLYLWKMIFAESFIGPALSLDYSYGRTMLGLLTIWGLLVINGGLITFVFRPILSGKLAPGSSQDQTRAAQEAKLNAAIWIQRITRIDLGLAVIAVALGASFKSGGLL